MYALRVLKEERIGLWNEIKLIVDTTEETTGTAIPYYFERNPTPDFNLALYGDYPAVIAEKGSSVIKTVFPKRQGGDGEFEFISLTGGLAANQIPSVSKSKILSATPSQTAQQLSALAEGFVAQHGGNFSIAAKPLGDGVMLSVTGDSARSSAPESGVNPIPRMLMFIHHVQSTASVKANHITDAAQYASENWGLGYLGKKFGIAFEHDFMGPLTAALTKVAEDDSSLEISVNLRIPVGKEIAQLESQVRSTVSAWQSKTAIEMELSWRAEEPMYRDPKGRWANALLDIASENLDIPRQFGSSAGGTSVHFLPNGVQFGLSMPDEEYTGHNANEFKAVDQFLVDLQIVTEMIIRTGQMNHLQ